jgi:hypothetical protein
MGIAANGGDCIRRSTTQSPTGVKCNTRTVEENDSNLARMGRQIQRTKNTDVLRRCR